MKTIGLIGGMSWESSAEYYRIINQEVQRRLGGVHSAHVLMLSVDFDGIKRLQHEGRWDELALEMVDAARRLERGGADFVVLCTNTMHRMVDAMAAAIGIPLLHIADPTAAKIKEAGFQRVGLLGTAFTMEHAFYKDRLREKHGLDVLVPDEADRVLVHRIIYEELVLGRIEPASREAYRSVIARLAAQGAQAVILGCTEIMLLVKPEDSALPLFDTTTLHALGAVDRALAPVGDHLQPHCSPRTWQVQNVADIPTVNSFSLAVAEGTVSPLAAHRGGDDNRAAGVLNLLNCKAVGDQ